MELREIGLQGVDWIHLKIGAGDGILWIRQWTFGFYKRWRISWLAESTIRFSR
jgi:hypothetical protein